MNGNIDVTGASVLDELFPESGMTSLETTVEKTEDNALSAADSELVATGQVSQDSATAKVDDAKEETSSETSEITEKAEDTKQEKTAVPEGFVPVTVHAELRSKSREKATALQQQLELARVAQAKAEARAELLESLVKGGSITPQKTAAAPVELSPLEKFSQEFPDEAVTARVMLDQRAWERQQAERQTSQTQAQTLTQQVNEGIRAARNFYSADRMGSDELTLDAVVALAQDHGLISDQDKLNLAPFGRQAGTLLYSMATNAIKQAGGASLQELNRRVVAARQALTQQNVATTRTAVTTTKTTNKQQPAQSVTAPKKPAKTVDEEDGNFTRITDFIFGPG